MWTLFANPGFRHAVFSEVRIQDPAWPRSDSLRNPRLALPLPASSRTSPFLPGVVFAVAGLQGGRVAHQRREDVQVEEGREGTLGALVVFYRGRVAVAQGVVFVALLPLRSFAHWPPLLGFVFPCPRATVGVSPDRRVRFAYLTGFFLYSPECADGEFCEHRLTTS